MCCLKYEQGAYEDAVKRCPKQDSFVECPDGAGTISSVNLLREQVKVRLEDSAEQPKTYRASEIRVVRSGKGKRPEDYVVPPKEELEKLRYIPPEEERTARKLGEGADLSAMLDQYLGGNSAAAGRRVRSVNRTEPDRPPEPRGTQAGGYPAARAGGELRRRQRAAATAPAGQT